MLYLYCDLWRNTAVSVVFPGQFQRYHRKSFWRLWVYQAQTAVFWKVRTKTDRWNACRYGIRLSTGRKSRRRWRIKEDGLERDFILAAISVSRVAAIGYLSAYAGVCGYRSVDRPVWATPKGYWGLYGCVRHRGEGKGLSAVFEWKNRYSILLCLDRGLENSSRTYASWFRNDACYCYSDQSCAVVFRWVAWSDRSNDSHDETGMEERC